MKASLRQGVPTTGKSVHRLTGRGAGSYASPAVFTFYVIAALLGGGLVLLTAFGAGDAHGHPELGAGVSDLDGHSDAGASLVGFRFWTHFLAAFGLTGLLLTWVGAGSLVSAIAAAVTGAASGLGISVAAKLLSSSEPQSLAKLDELIGLEGRVVVTVGGSDQPGKIRVTARGELLDLTAECDEPGGIEIGADIVVVEVRAHRVGIVRRGELGLSPLRTRGLLAEGEKNGG
ncbi:MAG: hypothetical protein HY791_20125 [Deltaproteobacteria bacterium]|nr:hypothetical protein [Deltaproteobacteria bacterium]